MLLVCLYYCEREKERGSTIATATTKIRENNIN